MSASNDSGDLLFPRIYGTFPVFDWDDRGFKRLARSVAFYNTFGRHSPRDSSRPLSKVNGIPNRGLSLGAGEACEFKFDGVWHRGIVDAFVHDRVRVRYAAFCGASQTFDMSDEPSAHVRLEAKGPDPAFAPTTDPFDPASYYD